nr:DUF1010 domain-containing protein [Acidovorax sp. HDW3]
MCAVSYYFANIEPVLWRNAFSQCGHVVELGFPFGFWV